jgi:hypothetical protein
VDEVAGREGRAVVERWDGMGGWGMIMPVMIMPGTMVRIVEIVGVGGSREGACSFGHIIYGC